MRIIILIIAFIPIGLFSQEQVSHIEIMGTSQPTDLFGRIGFALIDGQNYMLKENDSLTIYRWEGSSFKALYVIPEFHNQTLRISYIDPNRSSFEIRKGKYYRFFYKGVQIIDIASGKVEMEYNGEEVGFTNLNPEEIYSDMIFFRGRKAEVWNNYILDLRNNELQELAIPSRHLSRQMGKWILGLTTEHDLYLTDPVLQRDSLVMQFQKEIYWAGISVPDSTFVTIDDEGGIWKIDTSYNLINLNCKVDLDNLRAIKVNGDRIIIIYDEPNSQLRKNRVRVYNLNNCSVELEFVTDVIESFAHGIQFVVNETDDEDYTLFGFYGVHPSDGPDEGLYYIIDHQKNHYEALYDVSGIISHTPFLYSDNVYMVAYNTSFWSGRNDFIVRYDFKEEEFVKLDPNDEYETKYVTIGFPEAGRILNAINIWDEDPRVYLLSTYDQFIYIQPLSFLYNLGVAYIDNISLHEERIYFTIPSGLYSVFDEARIEIPLQIESPIPDPFYEELLAFYDNRFCLNYSDENKTYFLVLDVNSATLDTIVETKFGASSGSLETAGPFIFYSAGNYEDSLHYLDLKTNTIHIFPEISFIISSWLTAGDESAIFLYDVYSNINPPSAYQINYTTNEINKLDIELRDHIKVYSGFDNSFYFVDRKKGVDTTHIRLLDKTGSITTIYNGPGTIRSFANATDSPVSFFCLSNGSENIVVVANDLENTEVIEVGQVKFSGSNGPILENFEDKVVLRTSDGSTDQFWFYQAFQDFKEIDFSSKEYLRFTDHSDSLVVFIYFDYTDNNLSIVRYNYKENLISETVMADLCENFNIGNGYKINDQEYLFSIHCSNGYEPWILNIQTDSLEFLKDINPGSASSNPGNFVKIKDWIYFTGWTEDKSLQWFRYSIKNSSQTIEQVTYRYKLDVFPSPSDDMIYLKNDFEKVRIYSMEGQRVHHLSQYQEGTPISIESLQSGIYIVNGLDRSGKIYQGKFVKVSP